MNKRGQIYFFDAGWGQISNLSPGNLLTVGDGFQIRPL